MMTWRVRRFPIAGRMMFKRVMGKASFCNVQDLKGSIQAYVARDSIGEESYKDFKKYDVGDIIGIKGEVFTDQDRRDFHPCIRGNTACPRAYRSFRRSSMD